MFCWSCGHENADSQKFCGECGRSLFKPEKVVREFTPKNVVKDTAPEVEKPTVAHVAKPPVIAQPPQPPAGTMLTPPAPVSNPLVEEPRVVHENPIAEAKVAPPPTPIHDRVPNRITGPSFLGLSDAPDTSGGDDSSYLLYDEPESSSHAGAYVFIALLVIVSLLVIRNWQDVRAMAINYSQKLGASDSPKPPAGPQRVTSSNDASQMTPDAAPEEGKRTGPKSTDQKPIDQKNADQKSADQTAPTTDKSQPQQTAKLDKPQTDESSVDKTDTKSLNDSAAAEVPPKAAPAKTTPTSDDSQLEEAQKYLQGRGVPQDCNRGLDLLRSAAKQPNAKARIQMAALYESGHCVTEDPVLAYSWFNRAQEVEPHNKLVERNLNSLWAKMSDEERREVTK
jgi:hypothetical protein